MHGRHARRAAALLEASRACLYDLEKIGHGAQKRYSKRRQPTVDDYAFGCHALIIKIGHRAQVSLIKTRSAGYDAGTGSTNRL